MKKLFPIALIILGFAFLGGGVYAGTQGFDAKDQVRTQLAAQNIVTPADASIPNAKVHDVRTAQSMANIIEHHASVAANGKTYAEMGKFLAKDGTDTNDATLAIVGADGKPVTNPVRNTLFQASALQTSLYTSIMAFKVGDLVIGLGALLLALGVAVGGVGVALAGLAIPALSRHLHVEPVAAH